MKNLVIDVCDLMNKHLNAEPSVVLLAPAAISACPIAAHCRIILSVSGPDAQNISGTFIRLRSTSRRGIGAEIIQDAFLQYDIYVAFPASALKISDPIELTLRNLGLSVTERILRAVTHDVSVPINTKILGD